MITVSAKNFNTIISFFTIPFLLGLGIDLYTPSLPAIENYFQTGSANVQLTISFYMLAFGVGQLFLGVLSDNIGRRKIILFSGLFFTIVSFLAAFSSNIYLLIFYRFLQGLGTAGLGVVIRAVAVDRFSGIDLVKAMTYITISWALGPIIGPFIGGYLQYYFNWQANFYFFGLYGLFIFIHSFFTLQEIQFIASSSNMVEICRRIKNIVIHPVFLYGSILLGLTYALLVLFNVVGPFIIQNTLKYSAMAYGHMALLMGLGYFTGSLLNRFLIMHLQSRQIIFFGIISGIFTSIVALFLGLLIKINLYIILIPVFIFLFLCGLIFPNMAAKVVSLFPKQAGTVNAVYGVFVAGGVFLMTIFATILKTNTQIPMMLTYMGLFLLCVILFFVIYCKELCNKSK